MGELGIAGVTGKRRRPRTTVPGLAASARMTCWSGASPLGRRAGGWISEAGRHHKLIARLDDLVTRAQAG